MDSGKKLFFEWVVSICYTFGTIPLVIDVSVAIGFMMNALPIDLNKSLWNSENGLFTKISF